MRLASLLICLASAALAACAGPGHYPLTGQACGPDDPVLTMDRCDLGMISFLPVADDRPALGGGSD